MNYNGNIYRPPIEAHTMLIPITEGCTHNKCTFCNMYRNVPFRMWPLDEFGNYVAEVRARYGRLADKIDRVYLVGADPFALSAEKLLERISLIKKYLPRGCHHYVCEDGSSLCMRGRTTSHTRATRT